MDDKATANGAMTADDFFPTRWERRLRKVELPAGKFAWIRNLTEREKVGWEQSFYDIESRRLRADARAGLLQKCLCNHEGAPLFPAWTKEVREQLMDGDGGVTAILYDAAWDHCGFGESKLKKIESVFEGASG